MKKLLPPALFLISILIMISSSWLIPIKPILSSPFTIIGVLPLILGLSLSVIGSKKFQQLGTNIKTFNDPDILVTEGLFKYSRNPMYLGFVTSLLGLSILLGSLSPVAVVIIFLIITDRWYIAFEEQAMTRKFGTAYETYKSQTRRWI